MVKQKGMLFLFTMLLGVFVCSTAFAFPNEPDGFKNMRWKQSVAEVKELKGDYAVQYAGRLKNADSYFIMLKGGDRYTAGYYTDQLNAYFYEDQLYQTVAFIYGDNVEDAAAKFNEFRQIAIRQYGPPSNEVRHSATKTEVNWLGAKTQILLFHFSETKNLQIPHIQLIMREPNLFNAAINEPAKI